MNRLRFLKLSFQLQATRSYESRGFVGNKVRGAIGEAMVHLFCPHQDPLCRICEEIQDCIYSNVFKPVRIHPEFTSLPSPFVIGVEELCKEVIVKGEILNFTLTVFGKMVEYKKQLIRAVREIFRDARRGFGKNFALVAIDSLMEAKRIWSPGAEDEDSAQAVLWRDPTGEGMDTGEEREVLIRFKTPLLTKNNMHLSWGFNEFLDAVLYRVASMIDVYEDGECLLSYGMLYRRPCVRAEIFSRGERFEMLFKGDLTRYMTYIRMGEHLHIGKKTTCGFGEYECLVLE